MNLLGKRFRLMVGLNNMPIIEVVEQEGRTIKVKYISSGAISPELKDEIENNYFSTSLLIRV